MHPSKVRRDALRQLTDLPNIGPAGAADLRLLGIHTPAQVLGQDPLQLYQQLCAKTGTHHDPCVLDVLISITSFMAGDPPKEWRHYTAERLHSSLAHLIPSAFRLQSSNSAQTTTTSCL